MTKTQVYDRLKLLGICFKHKIGHTASALSMVDWFGAVSDACDFRKDQLVIGNANVPVVFNDFYSDTSSDNDQYASIQNSDCKYQSIGLGNAIGIGSGIALGCKDTKTVITVGDSILHAGTELEACMYIGQNKRMFKNLLICINSNEAGCISYFPGFRDTIVKTLTAFGLEGYVIDGHNEDDLANVKTIIQNQSSPLFLVFKTVKGKGVQFMEVDPSEWHYRVMTQSEYDLAVSQVKSCLQS